MKYKCGVFSECGDVRMRLNENPSVPALKP